MTTGGSPTLLLALNQALSVHQRGHGGAETIVDRIFGVIASRILSGEVRPGVRLPSVRDLAQACRVSRDTAARAYDKLVAHGHVEARRGSGYFAKFVSKGGRSTEDIRAGTPLAHVLSTRHKQLFDLEAGDSLPLGTGQLPIGWFDEAKLASAMRYVARSSNKSIYQYGDPLGYLPLRRQLQVQLQDIGVQADAGQIITTHGCSDAINLVAQAFLHRPGDKVIVEEPGPFLVRHRLASCGYDFLFVPRLRDGPDLDVLRQLCEAHKPAAFFCSSILHNPTSTNIAPHKLFQILQMAEEFDLMVVEDDTYGDLLSPSRRAQIGRLATLDQLKHVVFISSFSKSVAPGLRCGYLAASPERIAMLATYKFVNCISTAFFSERVMYRLLSSGDHRRQCESLRTHLDNARGTVVRQILDAGLRLEIEPESGMYLWARVPPDIQASALADRMQELGHALAPDRLFSGLRHAPDTHLRFNIASTLDSPAIGMLGRLLGK